MRQVHAAHATIVKVCRQHTSNWNVFIVKVQRDRWDREVAMRRQGMHVPTPYSDVVNAYARAYALAQQSTYGSAYGYDPAAQWRYLMQQHEPYNRQLLFCLLLFDR